MINHYLFIFHINFSFNQTFPLTLHFLLLCVLIILLNFRIWINKFRLHINYDDLYFIIKLKLEL